RSSTDHRPREGTTNAHRTGHPPDMDILSRGAGRDRIDRHARRPSARRVRRQRYPVNRRATFQAIPPPNFPRQRQQALTLGAAVGLITVAMTLIFWVVIR